MGMSTDIKGVRDLSVKFDKMAKIKEACDDAGGISYPKEIEDYFGSDCDESLEYLRQAMEECDIPFEEVGGDMEEGWEVDLSKLPKDVKKIRFRNCY